MRISRFILAFVIVLGMAGCDTFGDLVPGITDARAEIAQLRVDLEALAESDDPVDVEMSELILARIVKVEEWAAWAEEQAIARADDPADWLGVLSAGAEIAGYAGVPGLGIMSLVLNGLRRRANTRTAAVVTTVESNRNGDGTIDWAAVREAQEEAGVHEAVRAIRKAEAAKIAAAKAAIAVT